MEIPASSMSLSELFALIKQLRDKETGCEWDKIQTFESLIPYLLEEIYEVQDAVLRQNVLELKQELGDVLFLLLFYADLAEEKGFFTFHDIGLSLIQKLIGRHPHIFSEKPSKVMKEDWESLKQKERHRKSLVSLLDDVPTTMPALLRSEKIQKRCASGGFEWKSTDRFFDKIEEELEELRQEIKKSPLESGAVSAELGDLLFSVVNLTRHLGLSAERVLCEANEKFERRFRAVEQQLTLQNKTLSEAGLDEMEQIWHCIKRNETIRECDTNGDQ